MNLDCGLCTIRPWRASDLPALLKHANDRRVWVDVECGRPHAAAGTVLVPDDPAVAVHAGRHLEVGDVR